MRHPIVQEDINTIIKSIKPIYKKLEGRTILISGGSGFLGSYFLVVLNQLNKSVFKRPCKVITVDNYITGDKNNILGEIEDKNFKFIEHDIKNPLKIKGVVDYIIHAAGIAAPVYYMKFPLETIDVATKGTQNFLDIAREKKVKGFLYFSSSEIYGDPQPQFVPTREDYRGHVSSIGPRACYDESKRLGETLCMSYYRLFNTPVKIVRPFNVYGPGMKDDHRVIPKFLANGLRGEPLPIHGKGLQTRTYCYIADATSGFFKVLLSGGDGEVYNIGTDQNEINLVNLSRVIISLLGSKVKVVKIPYPSSYPADEPNRRCPDLTKSGKELKYTPTTDIKTGLKRTISWYKDEHRF